MKFFQQIWYYFLPGFNKIIIYYKQYIYVYYNKLIFSEPHGTCHIKTTVLDNENSLKFKQCAQETSYYRDPRRFIDLKGIVECELPNKMLYNFLGRLTIQNNP